MGDGWICMYIYVHCTDVYAIFGVLSSKTSFWQGSGSGNEIGVHAKCCVRLLQCMTIANLTMVVM